MNDALRIYRFPSPLGMISYAMEDGLCRHLWLSDVGGSADGVTSVSDWLGEYFAGNPVPLPALSAPCTSFQARLRQVLIDIPFGSIRTYGDLARELGSGARAVGQALGANPLPILVPCHRVVSSQGLGGFSGGIEWKRKLLAFERLTGPGNPWPAKESRRTP